MEVYHTSVPESNGREGCFDHGTWRVREVIMTGDLRTHSSLRGAEATKQSPSQYRSGEPLDPDSGQDDAQDDQEGQEVWKAEVQLLQSSTLR
jgi:hypothetical protein